MAFYVHRLKKSDTEYNVNIYRKLILGIWNSERGGPEYRETVGGPPLVLRGRKEPECQGLLQARARVEQALHLRTLQR